MSTPETAANYHNASLRLRQGKPRVRVKIRRVNTEFIVDSGSGVSLIKPGIPHGQVKPFWTTSFGVTGDELDTRGEQDVQFCLKNWNNRNTFCVCPLPTNADGIVGMYFLKEINTSLDIGKRVFTVRKRQIPRRDTRRANGNCDRAAITVFSETKGKRRRNTQTPKSDFKTKRKECSKTGHRNASVREAQTVTLERQHSEKEGKRRKGLSRKRQGKHRSFEVRDSVYLNNPARRPDLSQKFYKSWSGLYYITAKISDLNYEVSGKNDKKQVGHVNRLKPAYDENTRESKPRLRRENKTRGHIAPSNVSREPETIRLGLRPLTVVTTRQDDEPTSQPASAGDSSHHDPMYVLADPSSSREEMQYTRSRSKYACQDYAYTGASHTNSRRLLFCPDSPTDYRIT